MLLGTNDLQGYPIHATDGEIGTVDEFYFDTETWTIRYLVVDTGNWLPGRRVLISPISISGIDQTAKTFSARMTKEQVKNSPDIDTHKPVSRQHEMEYFNYFGSPYYWHGGGLWGTGYFPSALTTATAFGAVTVAEPPPPTDQADSHLRSTNVVRKNYLEAADGELGHVDDFMIDDETWAIRYLVVDTRNWWPGKKVLVPPQWIERLNWEDSKVNVGLQREAIKSAPEFDSSASISREYEEKLYRHYGRPGYWNFESVGRSRSA